MGTTIRRQPISFDIPKAPDYKFLNITNFRGLDVSSNPFELATNTASDCLNVYVDETNTLTTRPRLEKKYDGKFQSYFADKFDKIVGVYSLHEQDSYLVHGLKNGSGVMYKTFVEEDDIKATEITGIDRPIKACKYFEHGDKIYLLDNERYMVVSKNVLSEVEGHIPTTAVVSSDGSSFKVDELNLLTSLHKEIRPWEHFYLPDLSSEKNVVDIESVWTDKSDLLTKYDITKDSEICNIYDDGSFCVKKNNSIVYCSSADDFETLTTEIVFQAEPDSQYLFTFAKNDKTFAVIKTTFGYLDHYFDASVYRFSSNGWHQHSCGITLRQDATLLGWSFSKDGSRLFSIILNSDGTLDIRRWRWGTSASSEWLDVQHSMTSFTRYDLDTAYSSSTFSQKFQELACFASDQDTQGVVLLTTGDLLKLSDTDKKLQKVSYKHQSTGHTIFDYTIDGSVIVLTHNSDGGVYIKNFDWENVTVNDWRGPSALEPFPGEVGVLLRGRVKSTYTSLQSVAAGWHPLGAEYRDIFYTGDVADENFTGAPIGRLGLKIPKTDLSQLHTNLNKLIYCVGDSNHLFVRDTEIKNYTVVKNLDVDHADYDEWFSRRLRFFKSYLTTRFDNNYWFASGNRYYRSANNDPTYFPITEYNDLGDANEDITGFNLANDSTLIAYKPNGLYLIQPFTSSLDTIEYTITESKNTVGNTAIDAPIITTLTETPLQINYDGIYGLSQLSNVSAVERVADLLSEPINERWLKENDAVIKNAQTLNRLYWTYVILPYTDVTKVYLLDNRTNSWYYWELPIQLLTAYVKNNVTELISTDGTIYRLTSKDIENLAFDATLVTDYYDADKKLISWYWQSQILPMGTMNYSKRLVNTTFILTDDDEKDGYGLNYKFKIFRKLASTTPEKEVSGDLTLVRSLTKKTNISKFGFLQIKLSNITEESQGTEAEKAYRNNKLRLVGLGLKYVLLEGLIR